MGSIHSKKKSEAKKSQQVFTAYCLPAVLESILIAVEPDEQLSLMPYKGS